MTEQMLIRLAMVLQDQAPSTLNKYICKLAEAILIEYPEGLSLFDLEEAINKQFNLSFTQEEILSAIKKKGSQNISDFENVFVISSKAKEKLLSKATFIDSLNTMIDQYISSHECLVSAEKLSSLILEYLYHCFNSNVENLLSLFNEGQLTYDKSVFEASNDEVIAINDFIKWDNPQKDTLIYNLVATCYEYCMLTIKKDSILSKELFKGKRFYLDANIIFRMAGINNQERETVTQRFVKHCKEAGIELFYTTSTLDEIYRVLKSQIEYIRNIAGDAMPVSCDVLERINPSLEVNDFYRLYCNWCQQKNNVSGDYIAFNNYLLGLIRNTIKSLKVYSSNSYKLTKSASDYVIHVENLKEYKNQRRRWRSTSLASAETDITNINDIINLRSGYGTSIWQTNDYIVSADQYLIGWANEKYSGVPIVVLPSVWLSIILRYTGRTDDDYKSFCLFLTQRQHIKPDVQIDLGLLFKSLNVKTTNTEIKEQIIHEITQNKSNYSFDSAEDYEANIVGAFDKVMDEYYGQAKQQIDEIKESVETQLNELKEKSKKEIEQQSRINASYEQEKTANIIAKKEASKKVRLFRKIQQQEWIGYLIIGIVLITGIIVWLTEYQPIYSWAIGLLSGKLQDGGAFATVWGILSVALGFILKGIKKLVAALGSQERENRLFEKYYEDYMDTLKI